MFYIYENWVAESKAIIHKADCGYCNDGSGCHENPLKNKNGRWHGGFVSLDEAQLKAVELNRERTSLHACCHR